MITFISRIIYVFIALVFCFPKFITAQGRPNFGLTRTQADSLMPFSKGLIDRAVFKKTQAPSVFKISQPEGSYLLNKGWLLIDQISLLKSNQLPFAESLKIDNWYNAVVPGTVLTSLVKQGVYPDPYIGLNNLSIPEDLCRKDWWYRIAVQTPKTPIGKRIWINFEGINYKAAVWINGKLAGDIKGAFTRGRFDITQFVKDGGVNIISVHIFPPPNPGIPHEQSFKAGMGPNGGQLALDGPTFISSEGWDWVPGIRDRNIGIWQNVKLSYEGDISIGDPQIITDLPLPDTSVASITIKTLIKNHSSKQELISINGMIGKIQFNKNIQLAPYEERQVIFNDINTPVLKILNPKLWWPNGYGNQDLYQLKLDVKKGDVVSDYKTCRFGIREFSYDIAAVFPDKKEKRFNYSPIDLNSKQPLLDNTNRKDVGGKIFIPTIKTGTDISKLTILEGNNPYLTILVNGVAVYCKGGNWGMDDAMKSVSREKLEPAFQLHKDAHFNMVRNWTGESTEEVFYELADEYGMLVWNDFWISTEGYNLNPNDQLLFLQNSLDVIKRFRNHPSIAIWCPRNEGYAPIGIEDELATQIAVEDGTRHYIGNSREINLRQSGGWSFVEKPVEYFNRFADGFSTEIGTFSVPLASTLKKFLKKEDWWPINDAWHYHDLHSNNQNLPGYLNTVDSLYGKAENIDDFSRKVQMVNYESHRSIFEAWNSKLWNNGSGVLLWMTHPAWPSMIWQTYSWDFQTYGSHYASKKACEPIHVQLNLNDSAILIINNTNQKRNDIRFTQEIYDITGKLVFQSSSLEEIIPYQKTKIDKFRFKDLPPVYMLRLKLTKESEIISINDYWKTSTDDNFKVMNNIEQGSLFITEEKVDSNSKTYLLTNNGKVPLIGIKLHASNSSGVEILPALFSDGYFNLMPGEIRKIQLNDQSKSTTVQISAEAYNFKLSTLLK
jgi:hypothetical protein